MIEITWPTLDPSSANELSGIGACFDIAGALLLARALVWVKSSGIMMQSLSGYGGVSPALVKMFGEQKVDASFGLGFLVAGFLMQFLAGFGVKSTSVGVSVLAFGVLLVTGIYYLAQRTSLTEIEFKRALGTLKNPDGLPSYKTEEIEDLWVSLKSSHD